MVIVKGENEFVYFLVVGLIILAVMLAVFGLNVQGGFGTCKTCTRPGQQPIDIIEVVKVFNITQFRASNLLENTETDRLDKVVFNGLLFGEDKIRYDLSKTNLQDVRIHFHVKSTNYYGRLIIRVNDQTIEARPFDPGDYTITVPAQLISDHMVIEIAAESSAWRIWAPDIYMLEDTSITFTSYFSESSQFLFYLGEEYQALEFAKVDLVFSENVGTLFVDINGRTIWASPVADVQSIVIEKSNLRLGDNVIKFRADKDSRFSGRGAIVVVYLARYPSTINQTGAVTAVQPLVGSNLQFYG